MINPLLHPHSSSAPTSPRCTRSVLVNPHHHPKSRLILVNSNAANAVAMLRAVPKKYRDVSPSRRRLSRVVKCRTVDFMEFPEGMRDYYNLHNGKRVLRQIQSQPGSPVIPRIEIHDFGSEVDAAKAFWDFSFFTNLCQLSCWSFPLSFSIIERSTFSLLKPNLDT